MKTFSKPDHSTLLSPSTALCVSIYLPITRPIVDNRKNRLKFKALLKEARKQLLVAGTQPAMAEHLLKPLYRLFEERIVEEAGKGGVAIFLAENFVRHYYIPTAIPEQVFVGPRFYLGPLLALLEQESPFYVLALSQNNVHLWQGTHYSMSEVRLENCPGSLAEALQDEEPEKQLQYHTLTAGGGRHVAVFHGQGARVDDKKDRIQRYCRQIDRALHSLLKEAHVPLILACTDYLFPVYQDVNTYPYLLKKGIPGNPDRVSTEHLHKLAWEIVETELQKCQDEAISYYQESANSDLAASDLPDIVRAAYRGKVGVLFVPIGLLQPGRFDPTNETVIVHEKALPGDDDLVDLAAFHTLRHGGTIHAIEGPLAAIYRK